jgi:23S rRNA (cytosine1962-C5)-methyltransferase
VSEPPRSPRDARRLDRLKHGSRALRDLKPRRAPTRTQNTNQNQPPNPNQNPNENQNPNPNQNQNSNSNSNQNRAPNQNLPSTSDEPSVTLSRRAVERLTQGHVWIYRSDVIAPDSLPGGEIVRLVDERGWFLGKAFYGARSQIAVRLLTREDEPIDEQFFSRRLERAKAMRDAIAPDPDRRRAGRLVHGEADLLPGLIVDRYADCLSVQTLIEATDLRREMFAALLEKLCVPRAIVERNDVKVRAHEDLPLRKGMLRGSPPGPIEYLEGEIKLVADLLEGQKTGAFLDQSENRIEAGRFARGRALDCFTYGGAFALQLARNARTVTAVDVSEQAAAQGRAAAERNGATNVEFVVANAFDLLRDQAEKGERYDTIVLDPPAFAKSKASIDAALRGYKEINLRAFHLLSPGGVLVSSSCSFHIDETTFERTVLSAASDARRSVQVVERRGAARDHPTLLGVPETRYLKCLILRAL